MLLLFFLKGIVVGIVIAVPVGPVGVMCVRRTVIEGKLAGFVSGLGAATADAVFGVIAGFGLSVVSDLLISYQHWLRIAGAGLLLVVGGHSLLARQPPKLGSARKPESRWRRLRSESSPLKRPCMPRRISRRSAASGESPIKMSSESSSKTSEAGRSSANGSCEPSHRE